MTAAINAGQLEAELAHFTGTSEWHRYLLGILLTDGARYLADRAGAWWLLDAVISYQTGRRVRAVPFQIWRLRVDLAKQTAVLEMGEDVRAQGGMIHYRTPEDRDAYRETPGAAVTQRIEYTDFPLPEITLYLENGVLYLPSER